MKSVLRILIAVSALAVASCAGDYNPSTGKPVGMAKPKASGPLADKLEGLVGSKPDSIVAASAPGFLEARWGSNFAYVTEDGRYAVFGDLINLETQEQVSENVRRSERVNALAALGEENMIEFAPPSPKYTVTVFTDVDCGYCRMLHSQVGQYNAQGIAIRYVFYPRSGPDTDSYRKAEAVWCSADRKAALTAAKATGAIDGPSDCVNPVRREWELGEKFGLRGTPMLVLPNGQTISGYVPPQELSARLVAMSNGPGGDSSGKQDLVGAN